MHATLALIIESLEMKLSWGAEITIYNFFNDLIKGLEVFSNLYQILV